MTSTKVFIAFAMAFAWTLVLMQQSDRSFAGQQSNETCECPIACNCDSHASRSERWYAGAAAVFLKPHLGVNDAMMEERIGSVPDYQMRAFDFDYEIAPRVWFGYESCDAMGFRVSYFRYDQGAKPIVESNLPGFVSRDLRKGIATYFLDAATTGRFVARTDLQLETIDLDATKVFDWTTSRVSIAAGLRYGRVESNLFAASLNGAGAIEEGHWVNTDTAGLGPTLAAAGSRPICGIDVGFGTRGSLLFGESDFHLFAVDQPPATAYRGFEDADRANGMFIGEFSLSAQKRVHVAGCECDVRVAWEGQFWTGMPLATRMGDNFTDETNLFAEGILISVTLSH